MNNAKAHKLLTQAASTMVGLYECVEDTESVNAVVRLPQLHNEAEKCLDLMCEVARERGTNADLRAALAEKTRQLSTLVRQSCECFDIPKPDWIALYPEDLPEPNDHCPDGGAPVLAPLGPKVPPRAGADAKPIPPEDWRERWSNTEAIGHPQADES